MYSTTVENYPTRSSVLQPFSLGREVFARNDSPRSKRHVSVFSSSTNTFPQRICGSAMISIGNKSFKTTYSTPSKKPSKIFWKKIWILVSIPAWMRTVDWGSERAAEQRQRLDSGSEFLLMDARSATRDGSGRAKQASIGLKYDELTI